MLSSLSHERQEQQNIPQTNDVCEYNIKSSYKVNNAYHQIFYT